MRTNYTESNSEEDIDMKNQLTIKNIEDPISITESASKHYADNLLNDPNKKNTDHVDYENHNFDIVIFFNVTSYAAVGEHLTAKHYVDEAISKTVDESLSLKLDPNELLKPDEQDFKILNSFLTSPKAIVELPS